MRHQGHRQITRLLHRIHEGDPRAAERLLPLVYDELRKLARARMARERPGQTLEPTGLVHEAYLRLVDDEELQWNSRGHFFGAAALAMRRIMVERARRLAAAKHGAGQRRVEIEAVPAAERPEELLALDEALGRLDERDPLMGQVVKLRYFAGLTVSETAKALELSPRTVNRLWTSARAWLQREIGRGASSSSEDGRARGRAAPSDASREG